VTRATDLLSEQRFFLPLNAYLHNESFQQTPALQEADRSACWLLTKIIV
jgi:hypothetical protein